MLDELYSRYRKVGFNLLGVNIDDDQRRATKFVRNLGLQFPILLDQRKDVSRLYDIDAMPATLLIDRSGIVRYVHDGYRSGYEQTYLDEIRELLKE